MRSFRQLLDEVLRVLERGGGTWDKSLNSEIKAQASLSQKSEDPVAQALYEARQALLALVEGQQEEACRRLLKAVRLHPNLGSGLAHQLAELVCQGEKELSELRSLREREERAWREAPPMVRLLRLLKELPPEVWESVFTPEPKEAPTASRQEARKSPSGRPFRTFALRPSIRPPRRHQSEARAFLLASLMENLWVTRRTLAWTSPEGFLRLEGNTLLVNFHRLPEARGTLLYLRGSQGSALLPLEKDLFSLPSLAQEEEEVWAELWRWEDLNPGVFLERYRGATHVPRDELAAWLEMGVQRGALKLSVWKRVLQAVRMSPMERVRPKTKKPAKVKGTASAVDPLGFWLSQDFTRPERSYNPEVKAFLASLLKYPPEKVVTEDRQGGGYPDLVLLTPQGDPWVVGDFKKEDRFITDPRDNEALWQDKRKYVTGLTRYVLFLTPRYLQLRNAKGEILHTLDLTHETTDTLREKLESILWEEAEHKNLWQTLVRGELPYAYLLLDERGTAKLQEDLKASFAELLAAAERALVALEKRYWEYRARLEDATKQLQGVQEDTQRRVLARIEGEYPERLKALFERHLPRFADQYGREVEGPEAPTNPRIREAFAADSAAALIARVLFLRFLEDLGLTKRRITNGGPERWREFVEFLTDRATTLMQVVSLDLAQKHPEPFAEETFAWILETNGELDQALQRLLLRVNAYDFSGLSEEILGDIYQSFLPPDKRKRLGEFYTPKEVVDLILQETVLAHPGEYPRVLDPACGSGSFLVRYLHHRVEDARRRGVSLDPEALGESIWGFDLNPFASYISAFQLLWGLLRLDPKGEHRVHVHNLNSLLDDRDVAQVIGEEHLTEGERARDMGEWDYVVGNPPYIRAERAKYGPTLQKLYEEVWGQNGDTGLLFLWRALRGSGATGKPWVRKGGKLGMVVSGGYASSEAAAPVWSLLWPGKGYALRKLVWLEFVEEGGKQKPIWDAARVPMVLIVERTPAGPGDMVELWVPSSWPKKPEAHEVARIPYGDFFDERVNPALRENREAGDLYGEYLLPLLKEGDIPLLRKLYPDGDRYVPLKEAMVTQYTRGKRPKPFWWTYGVQRGGVEATEEPTGAKPVPVIAGRGLAVAYPGEPVGYVDLEAVQKRPYGKLSLWGNENTPETYLVVANIALAPFGALVTKREDEAAPVPLDTLIVGVPKENLGEALAAYLNSSLARWYYLVRLRSGVLEGSSRAHIYPRTLEALPWPKDADRHTLGRLAVLYQELEHLAQASRDNPRAWLLAKVERRIEDQAGYRLSAPGFGLSFVEWQGAPSMEELVLEGTVLQAGLFNRLDLKDPDLARFVYLMLTSTEAERVASGELQRLFVPTDYKDLLAVYEEKERAFSEVREAFFRTLAELDEAVFDLFGLTEEERRHILERLSAFPLDRLRPRYPWEVGRVRPLKAYTEDRFR